MKSALTAFVFLLTCATTFAASASASPFSQNGDELTLTCASATLTFSANDGRIVRLADAKGMVLAGPSYGGNLWQVEPGINEKNFGCFDHDAPLGKLNRMIPSSLFQAERKTFTWAWDATNRVLRLSYESEFQPVRVKVDVSVIDDGFRFVPQMSIDGPQSVDFQIPCLILDYKTIQRFHAPNDFAVALTPQFFTEGRSFAMRYPVGFGDMMFWTRTDQAGPVAIYRSEADTPFIPSTSAVRGGSTDPAASNLPSLFHRTYHFFAKDKAWIHCPQFDITVGTDMRTISRRYAELRRLGPKVAEKLSKDTYEKLIRSVTIKYGSSTMTGLAAAAMNDYDNQRKSLSRYPSPAVIHIISYLYYGFDRGNPDYLPPAPCGGGPVPFDALITEIHKQGKLWMPYTNPTFWNMVPDNKDRIPYKHGTDVFLRSRNREFCYNGGSFDATAGGRMVSPMHPTVVKVNEDIYREFVSKWKTDLVFADQLANRWGDSDFNPKTGYPPHGYIQQLTDLAAKLKTIVPFAMEGGFDLQVPNAVVFHTLSWPMQGDPAKETDYNGRYGKGGWEWSPMFMYAVHDRVISNLHDLGDKVDTPQRLSSALTHGYAMMSNVGDGDCDTVKDEDPRMRWLWWIDAVQKNICARYLGQELLTFAYIDKYVVSASYPNLKMIVNLTETPYELKDKKITLAPYGWLVESDDQSLYAASILKADKTPISLIRVRENGADRLWLHADNAGTFDYIDAGGATHTLTIPQLPQREPIVVSATTQPARKQ